MIYPLLHKNERYNEATSADDTSVKATSVEDTANNSATNEFTAIELTAIELTSDSSEDIAVVVVQIPKLFKHLQLHLLKH